MSRNLTAKQEKFCQCIAKGNSQIDAYREAYPTSKKWKRKTIDENSSKLMKNAKIMPRVNELKAKTEEKTIEKFAKSKVKILQEFEELIKTAKDEKDLREVRECLKEQAKLLNYYDESDGKFLFGKCNNFNLNVQIVSANKKKEIE